jgi:putative heme-binding domain-containing protein
VGDYTPPPPTGGMSPQAGRALPGLPLVMRSSEKPFATGVSWTLVIALGTLALANEAPGSQPAGNATASADRPAAIWPSGPLDVVAAFERPIEPARAQALVGQSIRYDEPADPAKGPGRQDRQGGALRIVGVRIRDSGRTLLIATDPHPRVARYVLPLAALGAEPGSKQARDSGAAYDLSGVEWGWNPATDDAGADPRSSGWWPTLDVETSMRITRGSRPHEESLALLAQPGRLTVSALVRLPEGTVAFRLESTGAIEEATLGESQGEPAALKGPDGLHRVELTVPANAKGEPLFLTFRVQTGRGRQPIALRATYRRHGDKTDHALAHDQLILPWAPGSPDAATTAPLVLPDLSGGDAGRGQALFSGDQARCAQCHTFRGQGGKVGPDLTEIGKKGRAEIYRSMAAPSAAIEPDYTSYTVATKDGQVLVGVVRAEGQDAIRVTDTNARSVVIPRDQLAQVRPSGTSIMPVGLAAMLGDAAARDIIAFLTSK